MAQYYLITYGMNGSPGGYWSDVIDVHPSLWLVRNKKCFIHLIKELSPEEYKIYLKAYEEDQEKEERERERRKIAMQRYNEKEKEKARIPLQNKK